MKTISEYAFETVIEKELLEGGYNAVPAGSFGREDAIFPVEVLASSAKRSPRSGGSWKLCSETGPAIRC